MKLAIITDTHWGARNDSQAFTDYFIKFYEEVFFPELLERGITTVIHMGDIVDRRKFINYKTLYQMRRHFFDRCWEQYINLHMIIGNHDTFFKNTNDVNSMDCLRMMRSGSEGDGGGFIRVYEKPTEVDLDGTGTKVLFQPWICDENLADSHEAIENTTAQILFGHLEVRGFEMHINQFSQTGVDAKVFEKFDMAFSGHFHHKSDNGNIFYLGNPYQITWSDYKDPRGFHIFDTETRELEFIKNPFEMFHKVYYDDEKLTLESIQNEDYSKYKGCYIKIVIIKKTNPFWFDTLMDKLYAVDVANISVAENFDQDLNLEDDMIDEAEDTLTILSKYVNSLNLDNKKELENLLTTLYNESLMEETV
jgi:DNA repair exonuclease SbcCD nuclease subunit